MALHLLFKWRGYFLAVWGLSRIRYIFLFIGILGGFARADVSADRLSEEIEANLNRVPEFKFISEFAKTNGIRVWLFGGTAAGYAHYVKWDTLRRDGDQRFQGERFDYDYTNIYRSNQDLDIVIDGSPEKAAELQRILTEKFKYFQGNKSAWEVRLLKEGVGGKEAILGNPNFLNQHTDSNSTGMVELSTPPSGEKRIRDVRDWDSKEPHFLKDVVDGKLHYYFNDKHGETERAKKGLNPPILSVIRYLTKAFQYDLKIRDEDLAIIKRIIRDFNPASIANGEPYVATWIEKNAKKLIQNAVNIESAWSTIESLGLRKKLIDVRKDQDKSDTLAWWLSREPLRTQPLGKSGKTARELGITVVAHETGNFQAYESITRAHTGEPNVLSSRDGAVGEHALYGDGFYTKKGRGGARGTKITIRFELDPNAREGEDFTVYDDFVVIKNKRAIRVIPESLNFEPKEYFRLLAEGTGIDGDEKALLEKFRRRLRGRFSSMPDAELKLIRAELYEKHLKAPNEKSPMVLAEWYALDPVGLQLGLAKLQREVRHDGSRTLIWSVISQIPGDFSEFWSSEWRGVDVNLRGKLAADLILATGYQKIPSEILGTAYHEVDAEYLAKASKERFYELSPTELPQGNTREGSDRLLSALSKKKDIQVNNILLRLARKAGTPSEKGDKALLQWYRDESKVSLWNFHSNILDVVTSRKIPNGTNQHVFELAVEISAHRSDSGVRDGARFLEKVKQLDPRYDEYLERAAKTEVPQLMAGTLILLAPNHPEIKRILSKLLTLEAEKDGVLLATAAAAYISRHNEVADERIIELLLSKAKETFHPRSVLALDSLVGQSPRLLLEFVRLKKKVDEILGGTLHGGQDNEIESGEILAKAFRRRKKNSTTSNEVIRHFAEHGTPEENLFLIREMLDLKTQKPMQENVWKALLSAVDNWDYESIKILAPLVLAHELIFESREPSDIQRLKRRLATARDSASLAEAGQILQFFSTSNPFAKWCSRNLGRLIPTWLRRNGK